MLETIEKDVISVDHLLFSSTKENQHLAVDDVESISIDYPFEVVDGKVIPKLPNLTHAKLQAEIIFQLKLYLQSNSMGVVFGDANYRIDPKNMLQSKAPDVSFILNEYVPENMDKFPELAPTLAVEIVSPSDLADHIFDKARYYIDHGVQEVWLIFSISKEILVYTAGDIRGARETLRTPLLPDFALDVKQLFSD